jgi:ABC-type branched-subunit amino acid transport system substrate-binding protein
MVRRLSVVTIAVGALLTSIGLGSVVTANVASAATSNAPIIVGGDATAYTTKGIAQGFAAGIYRFNKSGGLKGRKIKFLGVQDDSFSAATALTNLQRLVENQHAMVIAPFSSGGAGTNAGTYLQQQKVPFIGQFDNPAFTAAPKWGFGLNGNALVANAQPVLLVNGFLTALHDTKTPGKVKLAIIADDYPTAIAGMNNSAAMVKTRGLKVVYKGDPVQVTGTTNYQPYAQAIIASGANAVYMVTGASDAVGLNAALKASGWHGASFSPIVYLPGQLDSQPNEAAALNGMYVANLFPVDENNTPAVAQAKKDLVSTGQPPLLNSGTSIGYWSAIFLEQLLKSTLTRVGGNPANVTGAALAKTVNGGWAYTDPIPGGLGTVYFPTAEKVPTGCGTFVKVVGTHFTQVLPYQCPGAVNVKTGVHINAKTGAGS